MLFIALLVVLSQFVNCLLRDNVWQPKVVVGKIHCCTTCFGFFFFFGVIWGLVYLRLLFPQTAPRCDHGIDFFFCSVFEVCGLSEVFEVSHLFNLH